MVSLNAILPFFGRRKRVYILTYESGVTLYSVNFNPFSYTKVASAAYSGLSSPNEGLGGFSRNGTNYALVEKGFSTGILALASINLNPFSLTELGTHTFRNRLHGLAGFELDGSPYVAYSTGGTPLFPTL